MIKKILIAMFGDKPFKNELTDGWSVMVMDNREPGIFQGTKRACVEWNPDTGLIITYAFNDEEDPYFVEYKYETIVAVEIDNEDSKSPEVILCRPDDNVLLKLNVNHIVKKSYKVQVNGENEFTITVNVNASKEEIMQEANAQATNKGLLNDKTYRKIIVIPDRLINIVAN